MLKKNDDKWKKNVMSAIMLGVLAGVLVLKMLKQDIFLDQFVLGIIGKYLMFYKI